MARASRYNERVSFDERAIFSEKPESRPAKYPCPRCKRINEYTIRWVRRTKKGAPQNAEDRKKFDKLRDHLLRLDDEVTCKTCGKKFEIPSLNSMMFLDQLDGLPKDVEADETDFERCLEVQLPYLGPVVGVYTDWTPLANRQGGLFPDDYDAEDPWQFSNVIVR